MAQGRPDLLESRAWGYVIDEAEVAAAMLRRPLLEVLPPSLRSGVLVTPQRAERRAVEEHTVTGRRLAEPRNG